MSTEEKEPVKIVKKSKKPRDGAFFQQSLPAWQPVMRPQNVLSTLFIIGILFCPIGGLLWWNSNKVDEIMINYSYCNQYPDPVYLIPELYSYKLSSSLQFNTDNEEPPAYHYSGNQTRFSENSNWGNPNNISIGKCTIDFTVPNTMKPPVFLYYRMTEFYQNHRQYIKNFDADQLLGNPVTQSTVDDSCGPLGSNGSIIYYPCGLIANSIFNDTYSSLISVNDATSSTYNFSQTNLAWETDKQKYKPTQYQISQIAPPPNWALRYPNGQYTADYPPPDLSNWEGFMVWMHVAALSDFRKIWGRNDQQDLTSGRWRITIDMNFDTLSYGGTKWIVLSTNTPLGGRNPYLGIAYMTMGGLSLLMCAVFSIRQLVKPRKLRDEQYLSWNQQRVGIHPKLS